MGEKITPLLWRSVALCVGGLSASDKGQKKSRPAWVLPVPCGRFGGGALVVRSVALRGSLCGVRWFGGVVVRA